MTGILAFLRILQAANQSDNHGVIPHGLGGLKLQKVDTCQHCRYCHGYLQPSREACTGCGAPNPCYAPMAITKRKDKTDVGLSQQLDELERSVRNLRPYGNIGESLVSQLTTAIDQASIPPVIFGEDDCDVDELRGDNTVYTRVRRCRRGGTTPPSLPYPERTSRYIPPGCREGERCIEWDWGGSCLRCVTYEFWKHLQNRRMPPPGPSSKIYR